MQTLQVIFDKYECDKGSRTHRYDRVYEPALQHLREEQFNLLEIGILRGESLQAWLEYFPKVRISAIDIFRRVPAKDVPILKHPRVSWCSCDSLRGPNSAFNIIAKTGFDVIIDDGLHFHDAQYATFKNFFTYLNKHGVYFIEDVWPFDRIPVIERQQHEWLIKNPKRYSDVQYNRLLKTISPYIIKYHDLRDGYRPDTFIIEVRKEPTIS